MTAPRRGARPPAAAPAAGAVPPRRAAEAPAEPAARPLGPLERWGMAAALAVAWAVPLAPQLLHGKAFVVGDSIAYRAYGQFSLARWIEAGERTFWNPYVFLGVPSVASLADPRPQWLPGPLLTAWDALFRAGWSPDLPVLLVVLAGMIAAAALARALWRCGAGAMAVAGLLWGLAPGHLVPMAFGQDARTVTLSLLPLALLGVERVLAARDTRRAAGWTLALAATLALQALAGHPQFLACVVAVLVPWTLARGWGRGRGLAWTGAAGVAGAALSSVAWVPALLYGAWAQRAAGAMGDEAARASSLAWRDLAAFAWPHAVGFGGAGYWGGQRGTDHADTIGAAGALLAALALAAAWRGRNARAVRLLAALGLAAALLALGAGLPGLGAPLLAVPPFSGVRAPATWMAVAALAGALLAALGLEHAVARARRRGALRLAAAAAALLAAAAVVTAARAPLGRAWEDAARHAHGARVASGTPLDPDRAAAFEDEVPVAARRAMRDLAARLALAGATLGAAALAGPAGALPAGALAAGLVGADVGFLSDRALRFTTGDRTAYVPPPIPRLARVAVEDPRHRVYPLDSGAFFHNFWIDWRTRAVGGLLPDPPRVWAEAHDAGLFRRDGFVRAAAVRYVAGFQFRVADSSRFEPTADPVVLAVRGALPRAYAVPRVVEAPDDTAALRALWDPAFRPDAAAVTTDPAAAGTYPGAAGTELRWTRDDPDEIALEVRAPEPAFVVVADAWSPGWRATLDGTPVPVRRVNHLLRGVSVPAGGHVLAMRYRPPGWDAGRVVTLASWGLWLGGALAWAAGRRRATPGPAP